MSEDINEKIDSIFRSQIFVDGSTFLLPKQVEISRDMNFGSTHTSMIISVEFIVCGGGLMDKNDYILVPVKDIKKIE